MRDNRNAWRVRWVHLRERDYLCDISVDGKIILKN